MALHAIGVVIGVIGSSGNEHLKAGVAEDVFILPEVRSATDPRVSLRIGVGPLCAAARKERSYGFGGIEGIGVNEGRAVSGHIVAGAECDDVVKGIAQLLEGIGHRRTLLAVERVGTRQQPGGYFGIDILRVRHEQTGERAFIPGAGMIVQYTGSHLQEAVVLCLEVVLGRHRHGLQVLDGACNIVVIVQLLHAGHTGHVAVFQRRESGAQALVELVGHARAHQHRQAVNIVVGILQGLAFIRGLVAAPTHVVDAVGGPAYTMDGIGLQLDVVHAWQTAGLHGAVGEGIVALGHQLLRVEHAGHVVHVVGTVPPQADAFGTDVGLVPHTTTAHRRLIAHDG